MKRIIEKEFEPDVDEELNYRYAKQCCFCALVDSNRTATKLSQNKIPSVLYFCNKHLHYVCPDKICDDYLDF